MRAAGAANKLARSSHVRIEAGGCPSSRFPLDGKSWHCSPRLGGPAAYQCGWLADTASATKTAYPKVFAIKPGDKPIAYGGFTCVEAGAVVTMEVDCAGMFFRCADGNHYLENQMDESGECLGISPALLV